MNGFDLSTITDCYIGSLRASAIYYGSTKIWPAETHDYSLDYLTFEAIQPTTFTFSMNNLQYSLDNGGTWTTLVANTASPTVAAGNKIMWKQTGLTPTSNGIGKFSATGNFKAYGNIMSLYYGDNFAGETDLTGKNYAFYMLFSINLKLVDAANLILPATILSEGCYQNMFSMCTSLTTAPELPATTLAFMCYWNMFWDCTSLTTAPELPATTLAESCYSAMFRGCTSLTTAPELPATTLVSNCYDYMFYNCTSLNYIKCLATTIPALTTSYWVDGVSASGTFVRDANTPWNTGVSGIPSGWTVDPPISHDYSQDYLTFEAIEPTTFTFSTNDLQYSLDDGSTWATLTAGSSTPTINTGNKILWKQTGLTPTNSAGIGTFSATSAFKAYGNIMSLYYGDNFVGETDLTGKEYAFCRLFYQNIITDAANLVLPATTLDYTCYRQMFYGCTLLTTAPELPATTLGDTCYFQMFSGCASLTTAPELPSTTLTRGCYNGMFKDCTLLTIVPSVLPATTLTVNCYRSMFSGCTSLTTAPELPASTLEEGCYRTMFQNSTSLNYIKCLATDISASNCILDWVDGVAASGTFVKDASMSSWTTGNSGIPSGWTVQNAS